jgi:hypothetical protein
MQTNNGSTTEPSLKVGGNTQVPAFKTGANEGMVVGHGKVSALPANKPIILDFGHFPEEIV